MNRWIVTFADGAFVDTVARDRDEAQERALDLMQLVGAQVHEIVSIRKQQPDWDVLCA